MNKSMIHDQLDSMSLVEYRARVERAAALMNSEPIYNGTTEHAQIVVEALFDSANTEVCVLNECVNNLVMGHDDTLEAIDRFLARPGTHLQVLVEREPDKGWDDNHFAIRFALYENVEIKVVPEDVMSMYDYHFTVADGKSYRFEPDKRKHAAIASFGGKTAAHLASIFKRLWPAGRNIEIRRALA